MIRTTISKIKKVCAIAFVPRLLRGNLRYTPSIYAAFGKFEKFAPNVKSVQKSTKASGDDTPLQPSKNQLKDGIAVVSLSKPVDPKSTHDVQKCITDQKVPKLDIPANIAATVTPALAKTTVASHYDKCSRVISQIFGEEKAVTPQEDLLLMGPVNMTDNITSNKVNNSNLITDKRTPVITFGRCNSKNFRTTPHANIEKTPDQNLSNKKKDNFQSVLCYEAVLMKQKEAKEAKESQNKKAQVKHEDDQQMNTCLYDVDPEEYTSQWKVDTNVLKILSKQNYSEQEIDSYWTDVYETAIINKTVTYEPNVAIDLDTIHMYKSLKGGKTNLKDTISGSKRIDHTKEELDRILRGSPYDADFRDTTVKSTTDKQKEEKLAQKIENIDETPLVEAETPKIEGFSTIPKILSNTDKKAPAANKTTLDEVVHRCLKLPQTQVDKILLKEMENLGVPITGVKTDVINTDNSQNKSKIQGTTKSLDKPNIHKLNLSNQLPNNLSGLRGIKLSASNLQAGDKHQHELKKPNISKEPKKSIKSTQEAIKTAEIRSEKVENANFAKESSHKDKAINQKDEIEINRAPVTNLSNKPNQNSTPDVWGNDHLDPKYILTCNETCPISPRSIVNPYYLKTLESTEAVYERNVVDDYMEEKEKDDDEMKKLRAQTDEGCGNFALREINRARYEENKLDEDKPVAYVPLDAYLKMVRDGNADIINTTELDSKYDPQNEPDSTPELPEMENTQKITEMEITSELPEMECYPEVVASKDYIRDIETTESSVIKPLESVCMKQAENPTETCSIEKISPLESACMKQAENRTETCSTENDTISDLDLNIEPYHVTQEDLQDTSEEDSAFLVKSIQATSEQLQTTSEQLQATTKQLQATSEKLHATSQELHETSEILQATSEQLDYRNLIHVCASQFASKNMDGSESVLDHPLVEHPANPVDPSVKPLNKPSTEPTEPSDIPIMTTLETKGKDVDRKASKAENSTVHDLSDAGITLSSSLPITDPNKPPLKPLTDVKDHIKLSELMKIVKERNQRISIEHLLTNPAEAKKSIPPMQQPRHKTPVFKAPSYPKLKPRPRVCAPRKKSGPKKVKCSRCNLETLGLDNKLGPRFQRPKTADYIYDQSQGVALTNDTLPSANLTEDIIRQLQNMGYVLESAYKRGKVTLESAVLAKTRYQFRTKSFEPWTPIPSWPFPKKIKRQKLQCPKEGCPPPPPRLVHDPPCGLKPCSTFPTHPKRTFTILDYCTIALGDPMVVDIGEF